MQRLGTGADDLALAVRLLEQGRLVAFPTETVYGLGADARNPVAVRSIFEAKGRPPDHPVIVHLASFDEVGEWAESVPRAARALAEAFWPGPLTLILARANGVPDVITGGQDTVGLRVPAHPVAQALLARFGRALVAPSANRFGRISPTRASHVIEEFGDEVAAVIDGGACAVGVESTIVDLSGPAPRLLRPGMIGRTALEACIGVRLQCPADDEGPRASGRLASHYAPLAPVELVPRERMADVLERLAKEGRRVAVLARSPRPHGIVDVAWKRMPARPRDYAHCLYAELRHADRLRPDRILVELPPDDPQWAAVLDRLSRAAARRD
ncbi:MAG: L-threonylcarbamoyladenylate synthase [Wenzhouxiangellaceae bacterium]